jgi:hypothetical protein
MTIQPEISASAVSQISSSLVALGGALTSHDPVPAGRAKSILLAQARAKDLVDRSKMKTLPEAGRKSKVSAGVLGLLTVLWPDILPFGNTKTGHPPAMSVAEIPSNSQEG